MVINGRMRTVYGADRLILFALEMDLDGKLTCDNFIFLLKFLKILEFPRRVLFIFLPIIFELAGIL